MLVLDGPEIAVENDALAPGERHETLSLRAADEGQPRLSGEIDPPGGKAGARDQDRYAHLHGLDHHLRGQPPSGVEDLAGRRDTVQVHVAGDLVDRVVSADILHIDQWPVFLA